MPPKNGRRFRPLVLVVDESRHTRLALSFYLKHEGYEVAEAASGHEAAEVAAAVAPDLVIVDLNVPGTCGVLAAQRLRSVPEVRSTPFIACAGPESQAYRDAARASGCDAYVPKPLNPTTLLGVVRGLLSRRHSGAFMPNEVAHMTARVM